PLHAAASSHSGDGVAKAAEACAKLLRAPRDLTCMLRTAHRPAVLALVLLLASCSNSNDDDAPPLIGPPEEPPERGALIGSPQRLGSFAPAEIVALVSGEELDAVALALSLEPRCSIEVYQIRYGSVGARDEVTESSGALMLPTGTD